MAVYGGDFELVFVDILFKQVRPALPLHVPRTTQMIDTATTRCWPWWCSSRRTRAAGMLLVQKARPLRLPWVNEAHVVLCNSYHRSGRSTARTVLAVFFYKQKTRAVAQVQPPEKAKKKKIKY
eukprot:scaffold4922_cov123-Isochrysis_galbana.AAC.1